MGIDSSRDGAVAQGPALLAADCSDHLESGALVLPEAALPWAPPLEPGGSVHWAAAAPLSMGSPAAASLLPVTQGGGAWEGPLASPPAGDGRPRSRRHPPAGGGGEGGTAAAATAVAPSWLLPASRDGGWGSGGGGGGGGGGVGRGAHSGWALYGRRLRSAVSLVATGPRWRVAAAAAAVVGLTALAAAATLVGRYRAAWRPDGVDNGGGNGRRYGLGEDGTDAAELLATGPPAFSTADVVRLAGPLPTPPPTTWDNPWANATVAAAGDDGNLPPGGDARTGVAVDGRPRVWALGSAAVVTRRRSVLGCGGTFRVAAVEGNLATLRYLARAADGVDVDGSTTTAAAAAAGGDVAATTTAGTVDVFVRGAGAAATTAAASAAAVGEVGPLFGASLLGACAGEVLTLSLLLPPEDGGGGAPSPASAGGGGGRPAPGMANGGSDGGGDGGERGGGGGGDGGGDAAGAVPSVHTAGGGGGGASGDPFAPVHFAVALVALAPGRSAAAGSAAQAVAAAADAAADALASRLVVVVGAKGADCATTCAAQPERGGGDGADGVQVGLSCAAAGFRLVNNCPALRAHFDCRSCELAAAGTAGRDMPCWVVPTAPVGHPRGYCMVHPQGGSACGAKYQHTRRLCPCVRQGGEEAAAGEERNRAAGEGDADTRLV